MGATAVRPQERGRARGWRVVGDADSALVARVRDGDDSAFEAIYDRYHRGLLAFCRHMLGGRHDAEDALQLSLVSAYRALRSGSDEIELKPWLYTIARNRCLSMLRARRDDPVGDQAADASRVFEGLADTVQRRSDLRELVLEMQRLPEDQRAALVLFELGDHSHDEIAAVLGVRREKVKALVFQAREGLLRAQKARDTPCADVREQIASLRGRVSPRSALRGHLDRCAPCSAYEAEVRHQRAALAAVLPVVPTIGLKTSVLGSAFGGGAAASGGAAAGGGAAAAGGSTTSAGGVGTVGGSAATAAGAGVAGGGGAAGSTATAGAGIGAVAGTGGTAAGGLGAVTASSVAGGVVTVGAGATGVVAGLGGLSAQGVVAKVVTAAVAVVVGAGGAGYVTTHEPRPSQVAKPAANHASAQAPAGAAAPAPAQAGLPPLPAALATPAAGLVEPTGSTTPAGAADPVSPSAVAPSATSETTSTASETTSTADSTPPSAPASAPADNAVAPDTGASAPAAAAPADSAPAAAADPPADSTPAAPSDQTPSNPPADGTPAEPSTPPADGATAPDDTGSSPLVDAPDEPAPSGVTDPPADPPPSDPPADTVPAPIPGLAESEAVVDPAAAVEPVLDASGIAAP